MTSAEVLALLAEQHEPYLPTLVGVVDDDGSREPTMQEQEASLQWWCDGCRCPADRCRAVPILAMWDDAAP